ncbi:hypothetical protein ciss_05640 [Carboxydothermus islandicus]|uniref:Uncharacterized protein n=1 Tax=Carboxydothermus islandicus TaxID=661089 RepID=A0A1L8D0J9_9THEO|nr:hypothetical protein [Carboxydothermus islandicus]GAV24631.1 hypothetical protein ciss_05640 [Carboxydothermus islandicus]
MKEVIIAYFKSLEQTERAIDFITNARLANSHISLICPVNQYTVQKFNEEYAEEITGTGEIGMLHDFHGQLVEMPLAEVPGVGKVALAGPISNELAKKGLFKALLPLGFTESKVRKIKKALKNNEVVVIIETEKEKVNEAANILADFGGRHVEKWNPHTERASITHG